VINSSVTLVFPHQLYKDHPALNKSRTVYLVEEWLYFRQYSFHKQKLVLHRASMKAYEAFLQKRKIQVHYLESGNPVSDIRLLIPHLRKLGVQEIHYVDVVDDWLQKRIRQAAVETGIKTTIYTTPNFLNQVEELNDFFAKKKHYFQTDFYVAQRKRRQILIDHAGGPVGDKWTFDTDNRQKFPKGEQVPVLPSSSKNKWVEEASEYVEKHFSNNYGAVDEFIFPVDHAGAEKWLDNFLRHRLVHFGVYEDAMVAEESYLYHSVLTPMLNVGLLNPETIVQKTLLTADEKKIPLNSLEGFIRQIIGWREFIRIVYEREGGKQRTRNYWGFTRKIPRSFWKGETGIEPLDCVIKKLLKTGYNHHIERLMVLGNFMLLCEFDPDDVHRWYMEMYIDSYDWVMVPNVYGMTQFADGGLMTTKPYISGSNYLLKMSDFKKGPWTEAWDGLFWRFMHVHRDFFLKNPRLGMLVKTFDKMAPEKQAIHIKNAEQFLHKLDKHL
jgi:deoxyribodipyrimidine photolyase-related protein